QTMPSFAGVESTTVCPPKVVPSELSRYVSNHCAPELTVSGVPRELLWYSDTAPFVPWLATHGYTDVPSETIVVGDPHVAPMTLERLYCTIVRLVDVTSSHTSARWRPNWRRLRSSATPSRCRARGRSCTRCRCQAR